MTTKPNNGYKIRILLAALIPTLALVVIYLLMNLSANMDYLQGVGWGTR